MSTTPTPWGSIISGATNLVGGLIGGIRAGRQRTKINSDIDGQNAANEAMYNSQVYSDYTQRADSQNLLKQLRENLDRQTNRANNTAVIAGGTQEAQAIQKEAANKTISDTMTNLGAMGQRWKDSVTNRYLARRDALSNQKIGTMQQAAQSGENLLSNSQKGVADAASGIYDFYNKP